MRQAWSQYLFGGPAALFREGQGLTIRRQSGAASLCAASRGTMKKVPGTLR